MSRFWVGVRSYLGLPLLLGTPVFFALQVLPLPEARAAFSSYIPLRLSGSVSYNYGYVSAKSESERMALTGTLNATGYIWQPWFATTSAALNLGVTNTETTTSSSDANVVTGALSLSIFPRSRFPFTFTYTRTDSRSANYSDLTQLTGNVSHQTTRISLRQVYRARGGSLTNLWYYLTDFESSGLSSESETVGATYQILSAPNTLTLSANRSTSKSTASDSRPVSSVVSLNHIYTPGPDNGVTNLISYLNADSGDGSSESRVAQASSAFYWRPEHRLLSVTGGVRASETVSESEMKTTAKVRSLNTNIGLIYRMTRRANLIAGVSVGSTDSENTQTLSTSQTLGLNYSSNQYPLGSSLAYHWMTSANAGNSTVRTDIQGEATSADVQTVGGGVSHGLNGGWSMGQTGSFNMSFSQGVSASKSSAEESASGTFSNSLNLSMNRRGSLGSTYSNIQLSDSRSKGERDSVFQRGGISLSQDVTINRLSALSGNVTFTASQQEFQDGQQGTEKDYNRFASMNLFYRHDRPFGVYNLRFNSRFNGYKEIGSDLPSERLDWDNRFQYSLGLLSMTASVRLIRNTGGSLTKSLSFQATRSF